MWSNCGQIDLLSFDSGPPSLSNVRIWRWNASFLNWVELLLLLLFDNLPHQYTNQWIHGMCIYKCMIYWNKDQKVGIYYTNTICKAWFISIRTYLPVKSTQFPRIFGILCFFPEKTCMLLDCWSDISFVVGVKSFIDHLIVLVDTYVCVLHRLLYIVNE